MDIRGIGLDAAIERMREQYDVMRTKWDEWTATDEYESDDEHPDFPRWLNAYELSRNLGGHEEGGWYYDSGEPVFAVRVVNADEMVEALRLLYSLWADSVQEDRPYTSVIGGCDIRIRLEPEIATEWPEHAPRYE